MELAEEKLYLTPFPFSPLFPMLIMSLAKQRQAPITKTRIRREYDFIVGKCHTNLELNIKIFIITTEV